MQAYKHKALVLGTNYYIGLSTIRCLAACHIPLVAADFDRDSYGMRSRYVQEKLWLSDYSVAPAEVVKELIAYAKRQEAKPVIIPTHDNYLLFLDKYQEELRPYYLLSLPRQGLAAEVVEKDKLYQLARKYNVLIPPTVALSDPDFYKRVETEIQYPLIVKPIISPIFTETFRCKSFVCHNREELDTAVNKVNAAKIPCFVQKIIVGDDENMLLFDAFIRQDGTVTHTFTGSKLRQWPINFGASCLMYQHYIPELVAPGSKFLQDIGWRGFAEIEYKRDARDNKIYLIEINARITNFNSCIAACGINVPALTYQDLTGMPLTPPQKHLQEDLNIGFIYGYENFFAKSAYYHSGQWTKAHLRAQEQGKRFVPAIYDAADLKPLLRFVINKIKKRLRG